MSDHYDRLENRTQIARETALFRDLRHVLAISKPRVPALRVQLKGIEVNRLSSRADLARIPVIRRAETALLQAETAPFGGLVATRLGALAKVFLGIDSHVCLEGQAKDWWGVGRGLYAAGLRKGMLVLNCFSYDLVPNGHMFELGARAIGCPVIPAGNADLDRKLDAVARTKPRFFCGTAGHLKDLLDHGCDRGIDTSCIAGALVTGPLANGLRSELELRGVNVGHAFVSPELGLVAFESGHAGHMILNENLVLEIVAPGTALPATQGQSGELVLTRINADYPLLRFGTGMVASLVTKPSSCGRTNMRFCTPKNPNEERAAVSQAHLAELAKTFPMLGRIRLTVLRSRELHVKIEHDGVPGMLGEHVRELLHRLTNMPSTVVFVKPGTLSDEDAVIVDERKSH